MSTQEYLDVQLGNINPEDKQLSPIEAERLFGKIFEKYGLRCHFSLIKKKPECTAIVSRIKKVYTEDIQNLIAKARVPSQNKKKIDIHFYVMVYRICKENKISLYKGKSITFLDFERAFGVNRKTLSANLGACEYDDHASRAQMASLEQKITNLLTE